MTDNRAQRRRLLRTAAALPLALGASEVMSQADPTRAPLLRRPIPATGETLPVVGLGTYQVLDVDGSPAELAPLQRVMRALVDGGGSLVDSSPMYGNAETIAGELGASLGLRARLFLATKVWTSGREAGIRQMEQSLARMQAGRSIDLMQVHNLLDWSTHLTTLRAWKVEGRVRYIGVTHYHAGAFGELERQLRSRQWDFVQVNYSLAEPEAAERLLPLAADLGVAVIANRPFAQGALFSRVKGKALPAWAAEIDCASWAQFFLKWIVSDPAVTCAIPASRRAEHMEDNLRAGAGRMPDTATRRRMAAWFADL